MRLAILGVPTSIGARNRGTEKAPGALRGAGLLDRLLARGHDTLDLGDQEEILSPKDGHRRAAIGQ